MSETRGKSDLGEKKKISGEIKVKSSLHDHSEMSAPQKMHIRADRPAHEWTHNRQKHTHRQDDWCLNICVRCKQAHANIHTHIKPHSEDRESKGHVWRRSPWEVKSRDCTCVPSPIAHTPPPPPPPPPLPPARTPSHTLPAPRSVKNTYFCSSVQRSQLWEKKGWENKGWRGKKKKKKKHIRGSLPVAAQHAPSPPQSRQSSGASLTHRPRANTHKPVLHRGSDGLVFEINSRKMKRQQKRCRVESEITARRRQTQAKAMWVGVVGEMSRDTAIDTVTMWTEPQDTSRYEQPISSQGLESSQHRK